MTAVFLIQTEWFVLTALPSPTTWIRLFSSEAIKAAKMEELYRRAYKILYDNRDFLLAVQKELLEHETLLNSDLAKIRESCI